MGREVINIRSCDMVVIIAGKSGTLGEFAIAYDEGRLIGIVEGSGGISDHMEEIVGFINKKTGAEVIYDADPARLCDRLLAALEDLARQGIHCKARFDGQPLDMEGECP